MVSRSGCVADVLPDMGGPYGSISTKPSQGAQGSRKRGGHGTCPGRQSLAVSQSSAALQRKFKAPLTKKRGRSVELTDAGHALAVAPIAVAEAISQAEAAVDEFVGGIDCTVRRRGGNT